MGNSVILTGYAPEYSQIKSVGIYVGTYIPMYVYIWVCTYRICKSVDDSCEMTWLRFADRIMPHRGVSSRQFNKYRFCYLYRNNLRAQANRSESASSITNTNALCQMLVLFLLLLLFVISFNVAWYSLLRARNHANI